MTPMRNLKAADLFTDSELRIIVGVSRHDNPRDVDEAYGAGTYDRLFPESEEEHGDEHLEEAMDRAAFREVLDEEAAAEEESDGPDPYDMAVETQMELEARNGRSNEREW